jgi:hypothetical protein
MLVVSRIDFSAVATTCKTKSNRLQLTVVAWKRSYQAAFFSDKQASPNMELSIYFHTSASMEGSRGSDMEYMG